MSVRPSIVNNVFKRLFKTLIKNYIIKEKIFYKLKVLIFSGQLDFNKAR